MRTFARLAPAVAGLGLLLAGSGAVRANEVDFRTWLAGLRQEAAQAGIRAATLDAALASVAPIPRVLELDRSQPERKLTFAQYIERVVNPGRIETARRRLDENRAMLDEVSRRYGVPPRFIVALWGIETDFGRITGSFQVVPALATLAYDGRRSAFFRRELLAALRIIDQGHVTAPAMLGSWAGAMGQSQFMPSSFLAYAVDYDGDGRRDIWGTRADVFASIANYLARSGWKAGESWGREVVLPPGFDAGLAGPESRQSLAHWARLGVRRSGGGELAAGGAAEAALVLPGGADGRAFLVGENFRVILKWNNSQYFASAVGLLADTMTDER